MRAVTEVGNVYGTLRVMHRGLNTKSGKACWVCLCDPDLSGCGRTPTVRQTNLKMTKRCGDCRYAPFAKDDAVRRRLGFGRPAVRSVLDAAEREGWTAERIIAELRKMTD